MTPLQAMMEVVVDDMGQVLGLKHHAQIDLRHDERVNAHCGDIFIGVFTNALVDGPSPDPEMGIDHTIAFNVSITQRTGYAPDDKMLRSAAFDPKRGCLTWAQRFIREMQIRRLRLIELATRRLEAPYEGRFVEPLKLSSSAASIRGVGPLHFHAEPPKDQKSQVNCKDFGITLVITYGGARYMENVIPQTLDAVI